MEAFIKGNIGWIVEVGVAILCLLGIESRSSKREKNVNGERIDY